MIRSPLRYPGGKSRAAQKICVLIPPFGEFREPFVGGGSVFIRLKQRFSHKTFWINDKYEELATFWMILQSNPEKLSEQIWHWKNKFSDGKALFYYLRENIKCFNKIETAAAFFVFNRITFSGTTEAGGFSMQAFEKRFTDSSVERLKAMPEVLRDVIITNADYECAITADGDDVFLFLDPPYFSATSSALYGKNGTLHKSFDHNGFAETLKSCPHKWLLTYDDSSFIRELFSFAEITSWNLIYGMRNVAKNSNQKERELLISNYPLQFTREQQIALKFSV